MHVFIDKRGYYINVNIASIDIGSNHVDVSAVSKLVTTI
jgi:hypothetical protein